MSDTWAGILSISVAVMALVQVGVMIALAVVGRRLMTVADTTKQRVDALAADVQLKVADVHTRVNGVIGNMQQVTSTAQQVVGDARDRIYQAGDAVRSAGHRVATAVDNVPTPVKRGVPAAVAVLAAYRTIRGIRRRMHQRDELQHYAS